MADRTPQWSETPLQPTDRVQYKELRTGIYALTYAVVLCDASGDPLPTDPITDGLVVISTPHHEIHEGETWQVSYKNPDAAPIADDGTIVFAIQTADTTAHIIFRGAMGGDFESEVREAATIQAGTGTAMAARNKNRRTGDGGNTVTVIRDPTITNAGVLLENEFFPGGTGGASIGGASEERPEWILKRNALYLARITNRAGNAQPGSLTAEWYEE
jgi:hypothetical protein